MSLNTIELVPHLLTELYTNSLLDAAAFGAPTLPAPGNAAEAAPRAQKQPAETPPAPEATSSATTAAPVGIPPAQASPASSTPPVAPVHGPGSPARQSPAPPEAAGPAKTPDKSQSPYKYLGNNGRKITFLVNAPGSAYLPDDQLAFLTKMLEACKMNMGDLALVNHAGNPVSIDELKPQLQPGIMVLFGVDPLQIRLPINFPQFKIQAFDGCQYLFTPPLEQLMQPTEEGKLLKTKLWVSLKTLFGV